MHRAPVVLVLAVALGMPASARAAFTDVTAEAGVAYDHGFVSTAFGPLALEAGGVAAGDYDGDGWVDLYAVRGDVGPNLLFRNRGDGTFEEVGAAAGVAVDGERGGGAVFADWSGDGRPDLLVLGLGEFGYDGITLSPAHLFRNAGDGTFTDVTAGSGLDTLNRDGVSAAFGDYDRDGDLDLVLTHWGDNRPGGSSQHLWRNDGGAFTDVSDAAGLTAAYTNDAGEIGDLSFTANFVDIDEDGWPDLLVAGDFRTSYVFRNQRDGTFADVTDRTVITDENGMGAAIADYDGDGHLDWFVSSIWDPDGFAEGNWYTSGNRLYRGLGDGTFADATDAAGVRHGYWGWGSTFQDFDNDGWVDLLHVNGFPEAIPEATEFHADPTRLFVSNGDGTFAERAASQGLADVRQGRGVVAFDYDRDGDVDLFVANNQQPARLYRNDGPTGGFLTIRLAGTPPNTQGIGALVRVTAAGRTQLRLLRAGSNYLSQDPAEIHVGLGSATAADVAVTWPDGTVTEVAGVAAGRHVTIAQGAAGACGDGAAACTPGGGPRKHDCLVEFRLGSAGAGRRRGAPPARLVCRDGTPTCDADGDATNGICRIPLAACLGVADPRLPKCAPALPDSLTVAPAADAAMARLQLALHGALGMAGPFGPAQPGACSVPVAVDVPLRRTRRGRLAAGRLVPRLTATAADRTDQDRLVLECRPAR